MAKIFLEIVTPGNGKKYEFMLDDMQTAGAAREKIIDEITDFEDGRISLSHQSSKLYDPVALRALQDGLALRRQNVASGCRLLLL